MNGWAQTSSALLIASMVLYAVSGLGAWITPLVNRIRCGRGLRSIAWFGALTAHAGALAARGMVMGTLPLTGTYEALLFYAWVFACAYTVLARARISRVPTRMHVGVSGIPIALIALAASPLVDGSVQPVLPVLRSHWLWFHVGFVFVGEGFLLAAFVASLLQILPLQRVDARARDRLDAVAYAAVAIGFPLFTIGGLLFGAVWAKHAWGRYWGWDPKETFMLVTWLVYVIYLHLRLRRQWRGRRAAWIAVIGFLLALFTFAGVNYLFPGLHGYV